MTILQDVNLDFGRAAQLVGAKFELKTKAELSALEAELSALPALEQPALDGFSVTLGGEEGVSSQGIYYYDSNLARFKTSRVQSQTVAFDAPNADLTLADLKIGEFFFYTGPAGAFAATYATQPIIFFGESMLLGPDANGGPRESIEVIGFIGQTPIVSVTPLTRGAGAAAGGTVAYFATVDLVAGVPLNVAHNLALVDKDAFNIRAYQPGGTGNQVNLDVDGVDANNLTITSLLPRLGVKIFVTGLAA